MNDGPHHGLAFLARRPRLLARSAAAPDHGLSLGVGRTASIGRWQYQD